MSRALLSLLLLTAAACAPTTPPGDVGAGPQAAAGEPRQCFLASRVNGFSAVDRDTVHVRAGVNDVFELQLLGGCRDVDWANQIGIRSRGGSDFVCRGFDAELIVPSTIPGRPDICPVRTVRQLTPEEVAATRAR